MLTEQEAIEYACRIQSLVSRSLGQYDEPLDGFCGCCPFHGEKFRNVGTSLDFMRQAVIEKLIRDGITPDAKVLAEFTETPC